MALSVVERISIGAPAARVWAAIRNFDGLQDWHPAVAASPADKANAEGSVRKLSLQGGGAVVETLERHDDNRMSYTYIMEDGGPLPVAVRGSWRRREFAAPLHLRSGAVGRHGDRRAVAGDGQRATVFHDVGVAHAVVVVPLERLDDRAAALE